MLNILPLVSFSLLSEFYSIILSGIERWSAFNVLYMCMRLFRSPLG